MKGMLNLRWFLVLAVAFLVACGGGGGGGGGSGDGGDTGTRYSGSTTPATVNDTNANQLAEATAEGAKQGISQETAFGSMPRSAAFGAGGIQAGVQAVVADMILDGGHSTKNVRAVNTIEDNCTPGGNAIITTPDSNDEVSGTGEIVFNNFCISEYDSPDYTVDGTVTFAYDASGYALVFDLTAAFDGDVFEMNMSASCDTNLDNCVYSADFAGSGGTIYRVQAVSVTDDGASYSLSARIYHPDYGYVDITATNITLCGNGNIATGTITVTDASAMAVMTVDFPNCTEMTVTYDGVGVTVPQ